MIKHNPIILALDIGDITQAKELLIILKGKIGVVKLGMEFFNANGIAGVEEIAKIGIPIFMDLKLHDIPNTVAGGIKSIAHLNPLFFTIHTLGGRAMMERAVETADACGMTTTLLGVTILTSMDDDGLKEIGLKYTPRNEVLLLARLAVDSGMRGLVCSPQEISLLRRDLGNDITLVTPGIRPAGSSHGDQSRVRTPKEAIDAGTDYIVIGRPITEADDPAKVAQDILDSL